MFSRDSNMIVNNKELNKINLQLRELAIKDSKRQITEDDYQKQSELLKTRAYEITQSIIRQEKEKRYPKKEPEKKTVSTKLSRWW